MFYPMFGEQTTFKFSDERKLRIVTCATEDDLTHSAEFDAEGQRCFIAGKDGNITGLTVGHYASLLSFLENEVGAVSRQLGIYNAGSTWPNPSPRRVTPAPWSGTCAVERLV